jgi:hypothetical protein
MAKSKKKSKKKDKNEVWKTTSTNVSRTIIDKELVKLRKKNFLEFIKEYQRRLLIVMKK